MLNKRTFGRQAPVKVKGRWLVGLEANGNQCGLVEGFLYLWDAMTYKMFMLCTIRLIWCDLLLQLPFLVRKKLKEKAIWKALALKMQIILKRHARLSSHLFISRSSVPRTTAHGGIMLMIWLKCELSSPRHHKKLKTKANRWQWSIYTLPDVVL